MVFRETWECKNMLGELESLTAIVSGNVSFPVLQSTNSLIFAMLDSSPTKPMTLTMDHTRGSMIPVVQYIFAMMLLVSRVYLLMAKCLLFESLMARQLLHLASAPLFFVYAIRMGSMRGLCLMMVSESSRWPSPQRCWQVPKVMQVLSPVSD